MNLENELKRKNERNTNSTEIKKNVLLLEETSQQERELLRQAGLSHTFDKIDKQEAVRLTRIKKQEEFNTKLYTLEEIKDLCIKYRLRFLPSKEFHGKIDEKLGKKLIEYFKERNIVGTMANEANTNLFILAKKRDFNFNQKENLAPVNPVLFYQVDTKEGKMYSIVTKWGRSFGIERRILGEIYEYEEKYLILMIIGSYILSNIITSYLFNLSPFNWKILLGSLLGLIPLFVIPGIYWFNGEAPRKRTLKWENKFTNNSWNGENKY